MKILKTSQVKEADAYTIKNEPIVSIDLMERAATRACSWIQKHFFFEDFGLNVKIVVGPRNNGGDGLVIARCLWENLPNIQDITVYIIEFTKNYSEDFTLNLIRLKHHTGVKVKIITSADQLPDFSDDDLIIDGIFGSGLNRPLSGFPAQVVEKINKSDKFAVISIDIPSGLFGEKIQQPDEIAVKADYTLTFEFPFLSFFFQENAEFVGDFIIIPIGISPQYISKAETNYFLLEPYELNLKNRPKFSHKGTFGHGLLISGGYARTGAAVLAAKAAIKSGIGLLTVAATEKNVNIIQTAIPEALIHLDKNSLYLTDIQDIDKYNAIAIGPAIGFEKETEELLLKILQSGKPLVIDADAITILSKNKEWLNFIPKNTILTPHPKEFDRLFGEHKTHWDRVHTQIEMSKKYNIYTVLKTAYTSVSTPEGKVYFNATGNPGLATGGSGDILTGMILSFLAQGYEHKDAAINAVYLHGYSADLLLENNTYETITPSEVVNNLSTAFYNLSLGTLPKFLWLGFEK